MRLLCLLLTVCVPTFVHAHDPYDAFTTVTVRPGSLELILTMAQSTVLKLIDPSARISALTLEKMTELNPRLTRAAAALFVIKSVHTSLTPRQISVELTEENDLIFRLSYPPPAPGPLFFSAIYLKNLGEGYGSILEINDHTGHNLGWEQLLWAHPDFEVAIPN
jgi:hypothetical protein